MEDALDNEIGMDEARESHPERSAQRGVEGSHEGSAEGGRTSSRFAYRLLKRAFDIVFSLGVIVVLLIPSLLLCLAIRTESPGNPIYSQKRVGQGGKTIRVFKIRTMIADADDVSRHLTPEQLVQWEKERKVKGDPRVTRVGGASSRYFSGFGNNRDTGRRGVDQILTAFSKFLT